MPKPVAYEERGNIEISQQFRCCLFFFCACSYATCSPLDMTWPCRTDDVVLSPGRCGFATPTTCLRQKKDVRLFRKRCTSFWEKMYIFPLKRVRLSRKRFTSFLCGEGNIRPCLFHEQRKGLYELRPINGHTKKH